MSELSPERAEARDMEHATTRATRRMSTITAATKGRWRKERGLPDTSSVAEGDTFSSRRRL